MFQYIDNAQNSWHKDRLVWVLILLSLLVYLPTVSFQFTLDDRVHILEDAAQGDLLSLYSYFVEPTWPGNLYRPVTRASLSLTAAVFGKNPFYYHLGNVLLHVLTVILGFAFIQRIATRSIAFSSMLIFACHPILSEAVANIYNRGEMLSAIGVLSVLLIGVTSNKLCVKTGALLMLSTSIACFSKESGFIIPLLLAATLWYRKELRTKMPILVLVVLTSCILFGVRSAIVGGPATGDQQVNSIDNILMMEEQPIRFLHALALQTEYIKRFIVPLDLRSDYSYAEMLPIKSFTEISLASVLVGFLVIATLVTKDRIVVFGLLFLLISLLPTANIFVLTGTHFALRLFYLPSLGFLILLTRLVFMFRGPQVIILSALCALPCLALQALTLARWENDYQLWSYEVDRDTKSLRSLHTLALQLMVRGELESALELEQKVLGIKANFFPGAIHAQYLLQRLGRLPEAKVILEQLYSAYSDNPIVLDGLGWVALSENKADKASEYFHAAQRNGADQNNNLIASFAVAVAQGRHQDAQQLDSQLPEAIKRDARYKKYAAILVSAK